MKTVAIIQARVGSTRLPRKVLLKLGNRTVLERVIERVRGSRMVDEVIVATTIDRGDLEIVSLCARRGIRVYCGSESDVLDRYYQASRLVNAENIVRITSDCPLIDRRVIDSVIRKHLREGADYTANSLRETFPDGQDCEVFTFNALQKSWNEAALTSEREHVTPYMRKHPEIFKLVNVASRRDLSDRRWTLDRPEDYAFIKAIYREVWRDRKDFSMEDVLSFLRQNRRVERLNNGIVRNEGYLKSLREDLGIGKDKRHG